ncbi:hypothetical protein CNR22_20330 [Sphingobacteriaceae bacterium]|nr:hypothetical protein CNR22_20330 [Sphingobacteriaceae bacterium]
MNEVDFFPYHNKHIVFKLKNGKELSGVLYDPTHHEDGESRTVYRFIPTFNMIEWKRAEENGNKQKQNSLEEKVDINNIVWAERVNY